MLWLAVSRAVRAPTLFDEDLVDTIYYIPLPSPFPTYSLTLLGDKDFEPENLPPTKWACVFALMPPSLFPYPRTTTPIMICAALNGLR